MSDTKGKNIGPMTYDDRIFYACLSSFLSAIFVDADTVEDLVSDIISCPKKGAYPLADLIIRNLYIYKAWPNPEKNASSDDTHNYRTAIVNRLVSIVTMAVCFERISNNIEIKLDQNVLKSLVMIYALRQESDHLKKVKAINIVFQ